MAAAAGEKPIETTKPSAPMKPRVNIPLLTDQESVAQIDQTETVIINGHVTRIMRGETVEVSPEVFEVLRGKYPNL